MCGCRSSSSMLQVPHPQVTANHVAHGWHGAHAPANFSMGTFDIPCSSTASPALLQLAQRWQRMHAAARSSTWGVAWRRRQCQTTADCMATTNKLRTNVQSSLHWYTGREGPPELGWACCNENNRQVGPHL
jgi:hypothetical protein